ncbi:hypothetical protein SNEBB_008495 [Seison nebaliae]|nr:hypothetical protein SNEBB_008495 [Seison nebaliae]
MENQSTTNANTTTSILEGRPSVNNRSDGYGILESKNRYIILSLIAFRLLAILFYVFGSLFSGSFVILTVFVIILLCCDFWLTKNVAGRKLAGLRWWNNIDVNGKSQWIFESKPSSLISSTDTKIFWIILVSTSCVWFLFVLGALFSFHFQWMLISLFGLAMSSVNVFGYGRCRYSTRQQFTSSAAQIFTFKFLPSFFKRSNNEREDNPTTNRTTFFDESGPTNFPKNDQTVLPL